MDPFIGIQMSTTIKLEDIFASRRLCAIRAHRFVKEEAVRQAEAAAAADPRAAADVHPMPHAGAISKLCALIHNGGRVDRHHVQNSSGRQARRPSRADW